MPTSTAPEYRLRVLPVTFTQAGVIPKEYCKWVRENLGIVIVDNGGNPERRPSKAAVRPHADRSVTNPGGRSPRTNSE